ncbi:hypothetical protein KJ877_05860 [bacterium]|nr:hypothetical protein [bacterium]MBU1989709.1 hypothetical protein [bacterium]
MNVSPSFSPSIKLMKPYFLLSSFLYLLSMFALLFIDPHAGLGDFSVIAWVHLYMIGFVMMAIFSAMAQLGVVIVEVKHRSVNIFKYLWILLLGGLFTMLGGFYIEIGLLPFGGFLVLIAMSVYTVEFLLTLKDAKRKTSVTKAMKMSSVFLLLGIMSGIFMSLGLSGVFEFNPHAILKTHVFGLIAGFVLMLIMGISIILIPMFGTSKRISDNEFSYSFITLSAGVVSMLLSPFIFTKLLENAAYFFTVIAVVLYFWQLFKMANSRVKVMHDIWAKSMYVGFFSFIVSFLLLSSYLLTHSDLILKLGMWILFTGFFGFLIIGNLYKIIPFLVWFHIYSPLIEERAVPMLHELLPERLANLQWLFGTFGLAVSSLGLSLGNEMIFYSGAVLMIIGGVLFFIVINKMVKLNL